MKTNLFSKNTNPNLRLSQGFFFSLLFLLIGVAGWGQATLPVSAPFDVTTGSQPMPTGFSQSGVTGYSGALKFDDANDTLILYFTGTPGTLSFDLGVNNSFPGTIPSGATFKVQWSANGSSYTDLASYSNVAGGTKSISTIDATAKYIRWIYTTKPSGTNIALKNVSLTAVPTITVTPTSLSVFTYVQGSGPSPAQSYNIKGSSLTAVATITAPTNFEVSKTSGGTYSTSITYTAAEANATNGQSVFVRLKSGLSEGIYGGSYVTNASTNATTKNISVTGSVSSTTTYTLTYNGNDNTSDPTTVPAAGSFIGGQNPGITVASPGLLAKTGYFFSSWLFSPDGVNSNGVNTPGTTYSPAPMPNSNITIYARWAFTVNYDNNGGTGSATRTGFYDGTAGVKSGTIIPDSGVGFTRTGYTFEGWKTTPGGASAEYPVGDLYLHSGSSSTVTLYAHWVPIPNPILAVSGTAAHGTVCVGTPAAVKTYTIQNTGSDAAGITVTSNNTDFVVSNLSSTSIPRNGTVTFDVTFTPSAAGIRNATITVASNTSGSNSPTINLTGTGTANGTPTVSIVSNPSDTTICAGTSVTFTATAPSENFGGGTASYQWKLNGSNVGSNATTYTNSALANGDIVTCVVTVTGGCVTSNTATSNAITMTVNPTPVNPNGDIVLENPYCGTATLVYELSDPKETGVTYYWQTTASGTSTANPLVFAPGAAVADGYTVSAPGLYYVRAFNGSCWSAGSFVTHEPVRFTTAVSITTQPANQSANVESTTTFTVVATGTPTYQWQLSTNSGSTWTNISGANSASYTTAATTLLMTGYQYRVRISNSCNTVTSNAATLTVTDPPVSIWSNEITGTNPGLTSPYTAGDVKNANISVSGISRGSGITGSAANNRYTATGWTTASTADANDYFEFTLTPNSNYKIDFKTFEYTSQISGGASSHAFRSSLDGFVSNIGTATVSGTTIDLSGNNYQNITTPVTFRFYTFGVSASTRTFSINDFDFTGNVVAACVPAALTAFPTSGPVNTSVTITGSNFTAGSTVKFGTVTAIAEYVSATQIKALVPTGANGNIIVDTSLTCDSETPFTLISSDLTNCEVSSEGAVITPASDLIIYEVYDENGGTGGIVSIYNGTSSTVNLSNYNLYRAGTYGESYGNYATMSGSVAPGAIAVIGVGGSTCGYTATNGTINGGFNDNDGFQLRKNAGATIVDDVRAPAYVGYYMRRNNADLTPNATYNDAQWSTQSLDAAQCIPADQIAQTPGVKIAPVVNTQPTYSLTCDVVDASLSITATEGVANGNPLAYQWYVLGTSGNWTAINNTGVYTGANSQTLNISDVTGLNNNQYYCQVRESTATCFTATQATQVKEAQNTWSTNVWSNGMPVLGSKIIIAGSYDTETNGALNVCELTVNSNASVRVKSGFPIIVKKKITNLGAAADNFVVESDANLIQQDNIANTGTIKVERAVTDMNNITGQIDYVYWSSPVSGQTIKGQNGFSPNTPASGYLQYNETNDKFAVTGDATFQTGKGYAIRAETGTNGYNKTYSFSGIPNNGDLQYQSLKYTDAAHGFNLVGNPYPSNIDFNLLHALNNSKIFSAAWFWTNNSYTAGQVGSGYGGNNYATFNGTGGTPATSNPENPSNNSLTPDGTIKVGQAFIVQAKGNAPLDFNNGIRVTDNGGFFQKTAVKDRFWLTLTAPNALVNTILIGYIPGATNDYETDFDGELFAVGSDSFYSILGAKKLAIQGKSNYFTIDDKVGLGNIYSQNGNYKISLKNPEGIFNGNQTVYLKDKLLKKTIKLNDGAYTFQAVKGTDITRFEIVYKEEEFLGTGSVTKSDFEVFRDGTDYVINSSKTLGQIQVYDAAGRLVIRYKTLNKSLRINTSALINGVYIIKAENSGDIRTKKIIK